MFGAIKAMNKETRYNITPIEVRELDDGTSIIEGYAAVFNSESLDLGGFRETVKRGAFKTSLANGADVRALVDHNPSAIIGRSKSGTLKLKEDKTGLRVEITPPATSVGQDIMHSIRRGDVDSMSFGFVTITDEWRKKDGMHYRELKEVELHDVSVVTYPAYPETSVAVRSLEQFKVEELEKLEPLTELASGVARAKHLIRMTEAEPWMNSKKLQDSKS